MPLGLLISPPWGQIMTNPHLDGFGSQLSTPSGIFCVCGTTSLDK